MQEQERFGNAEHSQALRSTASLHGGLCKEAGLLRISRGVMDVTSSRDGQACLLDLLAASMPSPSSPLLSPRCPSVVINSLTHDDFVPRSLTAIAPAGRLLELSKLGAWSSAQVAAFRPDVHYGALLLDGRIAQAPCSLESELRAIASHLSMGEFKLPPITKNLRPI